jgi:hypothetical protein
MDDLEQNNLDSTQTLQEPSEVSEWQLNDHNDTDVVDKTARRRLQNRQAQRNHSNYSLDYSFESY